MTTKTQTIDWWLDSLEDVKPVSDGWSAKCPAHHDLKNSLHLTKQGDGVVVHCFAGCRYEDIVEKIESRPKLMITRVPAKTVGGKSARDWWESYTGVSAEEWESWGVSFDGSNITFHWGPGTAKKVRKSGTKEFNWSPSGSRPPLWPVIPPELPREIWVSEGESDGGVLRHLGFAAFALTKGANSSPSQAVWEELKRRGAGIVFVCLDLDSAGDEGSRTLIEEITSAGLECRKVRLETVVDPLLGEKDVRDFWLRNADEETCRELLRKATSLLTEHKLQKVSLDEFLKSSVESQHWTVDGVWLEETIGMIVGSPKMGKSWLAMDLGLSVASGRPFLGEFEVTSPGPVAYVPKEDPSHLLYDRLAKVASSKGLGGSVDGLHIELPTKTGAVPFYVDLTRSFTFEEDAVAALFSWLYRIKEQHGALSMVILDPILRMMAGIDEYRATEVGGSVFRVAEQIQSTFGSSVCLVHHRGKGQTVGKSSYGSIGFHAFSEATLYIGGDEAKPDDWRVVKGEYKSAPDSQWAYRFPQLDEEYEVEVDRDPTSHQVTVTAVDMSDAILVTLKSSPSGLSVDEITTALDGPSHYTVRNLLKELEMKGLISRQQGKGAGGTRGPKKDLWVAS